MKFKIMLLSFLFSGLCCAQNDRPSPRLIIDRVDDSIFVLLKNEDSRVVEVNGDFSLNREGGNFKLIIFDEKNTEYKLSGVIDGVENDSTISLGRNNLYGKSFKISNIKLYYGLDKGLYKIKANYLWGTDNNKINVESEWYSFEVY